VSFVPSPSASPVLGSCCCDELRNEEQLLLQEAILLQGKVQNITKQLDLIDDLVDSVEVILDLPRLIRAIEHLLSKEIDGDDDDGGIIGKKNLEAGKTIL